MQCGTFRDNNEMPKIIWLLSLLMVKGEKTALVCLFVCNKTCLVGAARWALDLILWYTEFSTGIPKETLKSQSNVSHTRKSYSGWSRAAMVLPPLTICLHNVNPGSTWSWGWLNFAIAIWNSNIISCAQERIFSIPPTQEVVSSYTWYYQVIKLRQSPKNRFCGSTCVHVQL